MEPRRSHGATPAHSASPVSALTSDGSRNILNTILIVLLIITSVVATTYLGSRLIANSSSSGAVKGKAYQALFLTNGQVYFGHISKVDSSYVKLRDIYYLQVQQTVQPGQNNSNNSNGQNVSLAKLGGELHGPEDTMYISRDQVLFWENLKDSGKVVQSIKQYQSTNK